MRLKSFLFQFSYFPFFPFLPTFTHYSTYMPFFILSVSFESTDYSCRGNSKDKLLRSSRNCLV